MEYIIITERRTGSLEPRALLTSLHVIITTLCLQGDWPRPDMLSHTKPKVNRPTRTKGPHFPRLSGCLNLLPVKENIVAKFFPRKRNLPFPTQWTTLRFIRCLYVGNIVRPRVQQSWDWVQKKIWLWMGLTSQFRRPDLDQLFRFKSGGPQLTSSQWLETLILLRQPPTLPTRCFCVKNKLFLRNCESHGTARNETWLRTGRLRKLEMLGLQECGILYPERSWWFLAGQVGLKDSTATSDLHSIPDPDNDANSNR